MDALILAGGLGTRLAAAVPHLPKTLAPIQDTPFLQILLNQLLKWKAISRVILAIGHKASLIEEYIPTITYPLPIVLIRESSPLGTGGALLNALPQIEGETFLAMNGDSFFDLDFEPFFAFHRAKESKLSIACMEIEDTSRYGSILSDRSCRITCFTEKSPLKLPGMINAGIYLVEKRTLSRFARSCCSLEKDIFPSFLELAIYAYISTGVFIDIGTTQSLKEAQTLLQAQSNYK